jgi:hypothetical protein
MAGFFDKERGMMLSYLGLIVFSVIKPLYALDEARYARLSQEATIALGRLDVLISMLKRRVL